MPDRRSFLAALGASALLRPAMAQGVAFDAVVCRKGYGNLTGISGPLFHDIAAALAAARASGKKPFYIYVGAGVWRERLVIDRPGIVLAGAGAHRTVIAAGAFAGMKGADGVPLGTFRTATVQVSAPDFSARRLTITNSFDYNHAARDGAGNGAQAVALALTGKADRSWLSDVVLSGHQDTLFVNAGRALFQNCKILGCVDFIFGAGRAFFEKCHLVSLKRPGADFNGYIAAPDTDRRQPVGFVFSRCHLHKGIGVDAHSVALGRPWRHTVQFPDGTYGDPENVGACAYIRCWMDDHIVPGGWRAMGFCEKGGGRGMLRPENARLFEYGSYGPGAGVASPTRRMLTGADLPRFTKAAVLDGWNI